MGVSVLGGAGVRGVAGMRMECRSMAWMGMECRRMLRGGAVPVCGGVRGQGAGDGVPGGGVAGGECRGATRSGQAEEPPRSAGNDLQCWRALGAARRWMQRPKNPPGMWRGPAGPFGSDGAGARETALPAHPLATVC